MVIIKKISLHVLLPILIGAFIYILFRKESLIVFLWLDKCSLLEIVIDLRNTTIISKDQIPEFILYSVPDGIWVYSFTYLILIVWGREWKYIIALPWILTPLFLSVGAELLQAINIINGTFCLYDMMFYIIGFILSIGLFRRNYAN